MRWDFHAARVRTALGDVVGPVVPAALVGLAAEEFEVVPAHEETVIIDRVGALDPPGRAGNDCRGSGDAQADAVAQAVYHRGWRQDVERMEAVADPRVGQVAAELVGLHLRHEDAVRKDIQIHRPPRYVGIPGPAAERAGGRGVEAPLVGRARRERSGDSLDLHHVEIVRGLRPPAQRRGLDVAVDPPVEGGKALVVVDADVDHGADRRVVQVLDGPDVCGEVGDLDETRNIAVLVVQDRPALGAGCCRRKRAGRSRLSRRCCSARKRCQDCGSSRRFEWPRERQE